MNGYPVYGLQQVRGNGWCGAGCGRRIQRFRDFMQEASPWNVNEAGPKTPADIIREAEEDAQLWRSKVYLCHKCIKNHEAPEFVDAEVTVWRITGDDRQMLDQYDETVAPRAVSGLAAAAGRSVVEAELAAVGEWGLHVTVRDRREGDVTHWQLRPDQRASGYFTAREVIGW